MPLANAQEPDISTTIAKAALRACQYLQLTQSDLGEVIGISPASITRLTRGDAKLSAKSLELALLFIRLFRGLDAIVGGDDQASRSWLISKNTALSGAVPLEMIKTISGLVDVVSYLDSRRAII